MLQKTILIVEDDQIAAQALTTKLTAEGFEVLHAANGEEGFAAAIASHPDLILLDVLMPKMDGITVAKRVREDTWGATVPIIILSNASDIEKIGAGMESGVFEYFIKSDTSMEHLVEKVRELTRAE